MTKYLRFKDIPSNEHSNIYCGDSGIVGEEIGVSCIELDDNMNPIIPFNISNNILTYNNGVISFLNDLSWMIDDFISGRITAYIITGDIVGTGSDGEPLLRNIQILNKLTPTINYPTISRTTYFKDR